MSPTRRRIASLLAVAALPLAASAALAGEPAVTREGGPERRTALEKMELTAFPVGAWDQLGNWTNGKALAAGATDGKVVVIATWQSFRKPTFVAIETLKALQEKFGGDVVTVAVHDTQGWEKAAEIAKDKGYTGLLAQDKGGFRKAINSDNDPDFYVIDRAGNYRFADIETGDVEKAVAFCVQESKDAAAAMPGKRSERLAKATEEAWKSRDVSDTYRPGETLDVPFDAPGSEAYTAAKWPEHNKGDLNASSFQGQNLPVGFGSNEQWLYDKPNTSGRVVVLDFWATWCGPCKRAMPMLDELQRSNRADLVIVGVSGEGDNKEENPDGVRKFLNAHGKHSYYHANDVKRTVYKALNINAIPHCVVISTDGVVRWQGNPHDPNFRKAVMGTINNDPGVKARRAAEAEYLKKSGG